MEIVLNEDELKAIIKEAEENYLSVLNLIAVQLIERVASSHSLSVF